MSRERLALAGVLVLFGAGWGLTLPLVKIAVSEGYGPFGLIFWQMVIGAITLGLVVHLSGRSLPLGPKPVRLYVMVALLGTLLPNSASYAAAVHLPAGLLSIVIAMVPIFAFPVALALGIDRFSFFRLLGVVAGFIGVCLIMAPEASLPDRAALAFVPLAMVAPFFYAIEGNVVAKWGTYGASPVQVLMGASLLGAVLILPLAIVSGQFIDPRPPWGAPDRALAASAILHSVVYSGYVWLVGRAGATFAAQVSYFVTGFGVIWAMLILGERYSGFVWGALGLMMLGLFLVQPRHRGARADAKHAVKIPDLEPERGEDTRSC